MTRTKNVNEEAIRRVLVSGNKTVKQICNGTNLSIDQVRRALSSMSGLSETKLGRTISYGLIANNIEGGEPVKKSAKEPKETKSEKDARKAAVKKAAFKKVVKKDKPKKVAKKAKAKPKKVVKKSAKKVKAKKESKRTRAHSVTSVAKELILAGSTNDEVWAAISKEFGLDYETKGHYPGWYRAKMVRDGDITKEFAVNHRK